MYFEELKRQEYYQDSEIIFLEKSLSI